MQKLAIVLAAGKGTRMHSKKPKVTHPIVGRTMIDRVLDAVEASDMDAIYAVVGHEAEAVRACIGARAECVLQEEQLGTGHAVQVAINALPEALRTTTEGTVLVTCGDTPLLLRDTLIRLTATHISSGNAATVLTAEHPQPTGYGRIVRDVTNQVTQIVEEKDANAAQKEIKEINVGTYCFDQAFLQQALQQLTTDNAQAELYLTDLIRIAHEAGLRTEAVKLETLEESLGVNNRVQLAQANTVMKRRINEQLMLKGVTMLDPDSCYVEETVSIGADTILEPQVMLLGNTVIGSDCVIGTQSKLTDATVGDRTEIRQSTLWNCKVGNQCVIGPYAYLRPHTELGDHVKVGDFVEIKNTVIQNGSKVPHLSYIGDADVGHNVNIGCGTITCNYDGIRKHRTIIGDDAFIGSNTNLVAPLALGRGVTIGAGSTITEDVESEALAVNRAPLRIIKGWRTRKKGDEK